MFRWTPRPLRPRAAWLMAALMTLALPFSGSLAFADEEPVDCEVSPGTEDKSEAGNGEEAGTLSDCDGLLHPEPVGDRELVEPAPDVGRTPIIKPRQVPVQPSQEEAPE